MNDRVNKMFETFKEGLLISLYNDSQITRSVGNLSEKDKVKFKKFLKKEIFALLKKIDSNILENKDIRRSIKRVSSLKGISVGQAQKVINVYLKVYSLIKKKCIGELDCPLDKKVIDKYYNRKFGLKKISLKRLDSFKLYEKWQKYLEEKGDGLRIRSDVDTWDKQKIESFYKIRD